MSALPAPDQTVSHGPAVVATPATPARIAAILALVVALAGSALGPTGRLDSLLGTDGATVVSGRLQVLDGQTWRDVGVNTVLASGTAVRTRSDRAVLTWDGTRIELAPGTEVVVATPLQVDAGSVLLDGERVRDVRVRGADAAGRGTWRVDAAGRVGAYEGSVVLTDVVGTERLVRRYEQVSLAEGVAADAAVPYAYVDTDRFDQLLMDVAMGVDDVVASLHRSLTATYGSAPQLPGFYLDFDGLDGSTVDRLLDLGFTQDGASVGPPADVLVASVVTEAVARGAALSAADAAEVVRDLRVRGATWGLIVQAQGLGSEQVRGASEQALNRRREEVAEGTAAPVLSPPQAPTVDLPDEPTAPPVDTGGPDTGGGPGGESSEPSDPGPSPSPTDPPEDPGLVGSVVDPLPTEELLGEDIDGTVDEVVELLDDLLDGPDDSTTSEPEGLLDGVLGTVGGLTDDLLEGADETTQQLGETVGGLLGG